jgi:hypothetical protein
MNDDGNINVMRDATTGRFLTGNSGGGGRPKGSRNKLATEFLDAMASDFAEHGRAAIERVRTEKPDVYLRVVADLMPRQAQLDVDLDVGVNAGDFVSAFRNAVALLHGEAPERVPLRPLKVINAKRP